MQKHPWYLSFYLVDQTNHPKHLILFTWIIPTLPETELASVYAHYDGK